MFGELAHSEKIRFHKVAVVGIDGVLRGQYIDRAKFSSALHKGFGFCDVVLGWDSQDELYDNATLSGWHTGYRRQSRSIWLKRGVSRSSGRRRLRAGQLWGRLRFRRAVGRS